MRRVLALLGAAHPGPALAVTVLSGLLGVAVGLGPGEVTLVVLAVATGQLSIGWSNDLLDLRRDRAVGRTDKPLASGEVSPRLAAAACVVALVATVPLSLATGLVPGLLQLVLVAGGWAYNLGLKATVWSWLPYAVAFAALPTFVSLAGSLPDEAPPLWVPLTGALLGVGAHVLNVLPDLADDAATGVRGMPHRLGARGSQVLAGVLLLAAALVVVTGASLPTAADVVAVVVAVALAAVAVVGHGRTPFRAAVAMALADVVMLVWAR